MEGFCRGKRSAESSFTIVGRFSKIDAFPEKRLRICSGFANPERAAAAPLPMDCQIHRIFVKTNFTVQYFKYNQLFSECQQAFRF